MPGKKAVRSHSKGASKGRRWAKGHSCVSNPTTTKFREQASSQFLHPVSDNPLFTEKNVAALQAEADADHMEEDLTSEVDSLTLSDISCGTGFSAASTIRTMSSAWSKCSTSAFDRFLKKFKSDSLIHKEMLSILAATSDVINNAGGKLNDTGFFATFITILDSCQPEQYQPVMSLVCIIIGRVSQSVLQLRFTDIYPKMGVILAHGIENNNELLMRTAIDALVKLLKVQEKLNLEEDKQLQSVLYSMLKCCLHEKPRVRKKSRLAIRKLISQQDTRNASLTKLVLGWILDQLSCFPTCETKIVADVLSLLLSVWTSVSSISKAGAKKLFEGVLRVMSSGEASIMKIGFSFFIEVFENFQAISECDPQDELFSKLIVAVWDLQTDSRNTECFVLWLRCILCGLVRLRQGPSNFDMMYLPMCLENSSSLWITSHGKGIAQMFKEFFPHLISESVGKTVIEKCFRILSKSLLTVPPNLFALQILEALLDSMTPQLYCSSAMDVLLQLIPLRNAQGVLSAMGKFIRAFGVQEIWSAVDPATKWLVILPLLNDNLHGAKLSFWKDEILPGLGTKTKVAIGWTALAGFCRNPQDPENFPAELVGKTIAGREDVRLQALAALRQFVEWPQCETMAKKYSKNYMPILFNLYVKTKSDSDENLKGHADAVGTTIQKYLEHCDDDFILELSNRALTKLTEEVDEAASPVFDLVAFLSMHVSNKGVQEKILDTTLKKWAKTGDSKRCYRIMTSLSKNKHLSKEILTRLYETLKETPVETKNNAAALRLECMSKITEINNTWLSDFLLEAIMNILSANAKAKKLAGSYVSTFLQNLKETQQTTDKVMEIILVGLSSPINLMVSCTLRFAHQVYKDLTPETTHNLILQKTIDLVQNQTDATIWKHGLAFLCLNLQLYKGALGPFATSLGMIVSDPKYPRKESTKLLARLIKVFGAVGVKAIIPDAEDPKMRNRIKNICKKLREKKSREDKLEEDDVEEEDESGDDMDIDVRMSNKAPLVMKEGVVDFLNPSDVAKSLINERPPKKLEEEFEINEDGKLVIDIEDDSRSKRKRHAPEDSSEEDDDSDDDNRDDLEKLFKNKSKSSAASQKSSKTSKSKYSMRSFKSAASASSRKSSKTSKSSKHGKTNNGNKSRELTSQRKKLKAKRFKSSSSVKSSKSGKLRKSSAASTYRLKL